MRATCTRWLTCRASLVRLALCGCFPKGCHTEPAHSDHVQIDRTRLGVVARLSGGRHCRHRLKPQVRELATVGWRPVALMIGETAFLALLVAALLALARSLGV